MFKNTSADALAKTPRLSDRKRILLHLFEHGSATTSEIALALGGDQYTASKTYPSRVKELVRMGLVEFSDVTKINRNGNEERLNELTAHGRSIISSKDFSEKVDKLGRHLQEQEKWRARYLAKHKEQAETHIEKQMQEFLAGMGE